MSSVKSASKQDVASKSLAQPETGMLKWLWLSAVIVVLDQITKLWVSHSFELYERMEILPFFNLVLAHNAGAAFSFLADAGGWQRWFFLSISVFVVGLLSVWLHKTPKHDWWMAMCFSLIIGGAIGNNFIDRVAYGYVVDFLDFHWQGYHFPAFNVADMAISVGAFMLIVDAFRNPNKTPGEK